MRRFALKRQIAEHFPDDGAEFESVTAETGANHDMTVLGMPVDNEVLVRRLRIEADTTFSHWRVREPGDMASQEVPDGGRVFCIRDVTDFRRVGIGRATMEGDFEAGTRMRRNAVERFRKQAADMRDPDRAGIKLILAGRRRRHEVQLAAKRRERQVETGFQE